ncbi:MAG TPA: hypothetical protein PLD23_21850, partial [Armatimonadota bacterium]|nr:hypothetical protein [Armatimonadota bacterium]
MAIEQRYLRQQSADIARRVPRRPRAGVRRAVSTGDSMPESDLQAVLAEASTRPDGSYEIAGLLPGAYAVAAIGAESGRDGVGPVFVTGDSTTRAPDLWLPRREGIPVRVRLVTEAGEPLGQQMVELTARGGGAEGSIVAQGPVDETGLLTLRATSPGWYGFSLRCSDGSEAQCWGVPVTAQGPTVEPTLTARRPARGRATVRIITPDGVPVSQCVWVFPVAQPGGESGDAADFGRTTPTDAEGVCVFEGLEPGPYMFVAQTPHTLETDGSERQIAVSPVVVVPPDGSAHVVAVLERLVRVAGRVCSPDGTETGPFLISASSSCGLALWPWLRRGTVSDNTGEFVLDGLYPGRWEVSAQPLDPLPYMWVETRWASPTPGGMEWVELTGRLPNDREEDPDEAAPITVTGRVVQRDGSPAAGAIVGWAENGATPAHQVLAGPGGEFSLPGVVGSQPRVLAWTPDGQVANRMLDTRGGQFPGQVTDPPPLELSLAPMPAITGWVVTPPGDPATSCIDVVAEPTQIWDTSGPWPAGTMCARVHAGPDGAFAIEGLKPGEYSVTAVWGTLRRTAPVVVDTFQGGVGGLVLTAEPLVPTLRLRLENDRSRPLAPGQPLGVSVNGSRLAGPMALVDGWVELCHTPPGLYQVWLVALAHDGTLTGSGDVTPLTSELSVRPSQWPRLRGRVVAAPGHGLHSGLRVALCSADQWMGSPTYYWDIEPDGTYDVPTRVAGELEVSLVAGRATRLAMHRVTVTDQAVTEVPDLVYAGLPSD